MFAQPHGCRKGESVESGTVAREVILPAPPEEVWKALTVGSRLSAWFGAEVDIEAHDGGRATFRFADGTERSAMVEVAEPPRALVLRWLPFRRLSSGEIEAEPATLIRFTISSAGAGARLKVEESTPGAARGRGRFGFAPAGARP
jgi:hypothetical protein